MTTKGEGLTHSVEEMQNEGSKEAFLEFFRRMVELGVINNQKDGKNDIARILRSLCWQVITAIAVIASIWKN